jgi:hypothetical protein
MLRASIEDAAINVQVVRGSVRVIISGLPRWAAMVLASVVLGGATREPSTADPRPRSHTRRRVCAILHEHVTRLEYQKVPDVFVDGVQQILPQAPQFEKESEREPEPEADPEPELELEQQSEPELESQESHEFQVTVAVRKAEGEIDDDDNDANGAYSRRDFDDAWRESTPEDEVGRVEQLLRQNGGRVSRQELLLHNIRTPDLTLEERHLRVPVGLQSLHTWLVKAQLGQLATQLQSVLPTDIYDLEKLRRTEVSDRCQTAELGDSDTEKLLDAWDALVGTTKVSQAPNAIAEGVPPERRTEDQSEPEPEDEPHIRSPALSAATPPPKEFDVRASLEAPLARRLEVRAIHHHDIHPLPASRPRSSSMLIITGGLQDVQTAEGSHVHPAVNRAISLQHLQDWTNQRRGKRFAWSVQREFLSPEDGGGAGGWINVTSDTLDAHRERRGRAERARKYACRWRNKIFMTMPD